MKKFLALLLCVSMILTLMPAVFATETDTTEPTAVETTVATESVTEPETEPTTESETTPATEATVEPTEEPTEPTEATTEATEEPTEATEETVEATEETTEETTEPTEGENFTTFTTLDGNSVAVGDKIYIKRNQLVYKSMTDTEGYKTLLPHEITIKEITVVGDTTWFRFENGALNILGCKYVKASSTSTTEPGENDCDCGSDSENLADHDDDCARKKYVLSLIQKDGEFKTAEEIFENWDSFDEQTKTDIWGLLDKMNPELSKDLEALTEGTAAVILNEFDKLEKAYADLPEDASYAECEAFYGRMMDAYSKAFNNDETIVTGEEMQKIDDAFGKLEQKLYYDHGYSEIQAPAMPISSGYVTGNQTTSAMGTVEDSLILDKNVSVGEKGVSDYLLTLESYVTGASQDYQQPVDLVLVLDQSASMYAPMGVDKGLDNSSLFAGNDGSVERYSLDNVANTKKLEENAETKQKASQLGYFVAQSRTGGAAYCTDADHNDEKKTESKHDDDCKTNDWFVVQYVEGDEEPWKLYRIPVTACPHNDKWNNKTYETECKSYASLVDMGESHFYFYKSQTGALFDGINALAEALYQESVKNDVNHRLAIAGFAGYDLKGEDNPNNNSDEHMPDRPGTCIYNGGTKVPYNNTYTKQSSIYTSTITNEQYKSALMNFKDNYSGIQAALKAVKTDYYGTRQDVGFDMAMNILNNAQNPSDDVEGVERKKIVVMFTDGSPAGPESGDVVAKAADLKKTGAEVYTICTSTLAENDRDFLIACSSDYPNASANYGDKEFNKGDQIASPKYAKTALNAEELVNQFLSIVEDVGGAYIQLDEKTVLQDALTDDFVLPDALIETLTDAAGTLNQSEIKKYIKVYTADYDGTQFGNRMPFEDAVIEIQKNSKTQYSIIRVTNFDYSENFVSENGRGENEFHGRKLIVEIPINIAEGSLGGNKLPTNVQSNSAIYRDGTEKLKEFPVPHVDVPTTVTVTKQVEGAKADKTKEFTFNARANQVVGLQRDNVDTRYLKATTNEQPLSKDLSHDKNWSIPKLYVGSTLTISETADPNYKTEIKVYEADGTTEIEPTENKDGSLTVTVVPGMKIVYTNTCLLTDLIIEKRGLEEVDENQSTIFKVTGSDNFEIEVVIRGNQSITIKDVLAGEYKVEELTDWSWRYKTEDKKKTVQVEYDQENKVTFINSRDNEYWLSGDAYCKNRWGAKTADKS